MYFGRQHLVTQKANVETLFATVQNSNVYSGSTNLTGIDNCRILRNDLVRFEDACYDPVYRWYVSLVLVAIMLLLVFFFWICLCLGMPEGGEEKKPEPRKPVQDTVEDDVVDINDNEKIPIS